jgi:hypothetical protein
MRIINPEQAKIVPRSKIKDLQGKPIPVVRISDSYGSAV